jgi:hypothetical protein
MGNFIRGMFFIGGIPRDNFAKFKSFVRDGRVEYSSPAQGIRSDCVRPPDY